MVRTIAVTITGAVALAALTAGCGSSKSGAVVATPTTLSPVAKEAKARQFVQCARQNGVVNLQDPTLDAQGNVRLVPPPGLSEQSPVVQKVFQVCGKYLNGIFNVSRQSQAQQHDAMLRYAACMRKHGMPNFPDPRGASGDLPISKAQLQADPNFPAANTACRSALSNTRSGG